MATEVEVLRCELQSLAASRDAAESAQHRIEFLGEASRRLASSLDYATTLDCVVRLVVPYAADMCSVLLLHDKGRRLEVEAVLAGPTQEPLLRELVSRFVGQERPEEHPVSVALKTGATQLVTDIPETYLRSIAATSEQIHGVRVLHLSSFLTVPLHSGGRILGVIVLARTERRVSYRPEEIEVVEELARRAAVAIDNALLHRSERRARAIAERTTERTAQLHEIALALSEALSPHEVATTLLELSIDAFDATMGLIGRVSSDGSTLELAVDRGLSASAIQRLHGAPLGALGALHDALQTEQAIFLNAIQRASRFPELLGGGARTDRLSAAILPLVARDRVLGVLVLGFEKAQELSELDRDFVTLVARQGAQALERARIFEQAEAERARLEDVERALRASEERYRLAQRASSAYLWTVNFATGSATYSDAIERDFKHDRSKLPRDYVTGFHWWINQVHPTDRKRVGDSFEAMLTGSGEVWTEEYRLLRGDGQYVWVFDSAYIARDENGALAQIVGSVMDVSDRKRVLEARSLLSALVEASDEAIIGALPDSTIESWNRGAERLFGYRKDEIMGKPVSLLVSPERVVEQQQLIVRCVVGERVTAFETVRRRKDGTEVEVSITLSPVHDAAGDLVGFSAVMHDITERKQLRARLALADRIASLGMLAAGVAHEIRNPLAYVMTNLGLIAGGLERERLRGHAPSASLGWLEQAVADAQDGVARAARIVEDLKSLSRADDDTRAPADLRTVLDLAVKMSAPEASHRARIVKEYGDVPLIEANEARLVQVFINLILNAAQALPEGAAHRNEIRVITRTDEAGRAVVEVCDTGPGIPPAIRERIFEPFFTTKPAGVGTGVGLSICQGIVAAHAGEITVKSTVGEGSVFRVTLPPLTKLVVPIEKEEPAPSKPVRSRRARILVIDDEVKIGMALMWELSREHEVEVLTNGREALDRILGGVRFDLILCDLIMPAMTGMALYQELASLAPDQAARMVFLTGGAFTHTAREFLVKVQNLRLEKPFDTAELQAIVNKALVD